MASFVHGVLVQVEGRQSGRFSFASLLPGQTALLPRPFPRPAAADQLQSQDCHFLPAAHEQATASRRLCCCLDSDLVTSWVNGEWQVNDAARLVDVQQLQDTLAEWQLGGLVRPWSLHSPFCRWISREDNEIADALANAALDFEQGFVTWFAFPSEFDDVVLHSDGASRGNPGPASCAAVISVHARGQWCRAVHGARLLGDDVTNTVAELEGFRMACELLQCLFDRCILVE